MDAPWKQRLEKASTEGRRESRIHLSPRNAVEGAGGVGFRPQTASCARRPPWHGARGKQFAPGERPALLGEVPGACGGREPSGARERPLQAEGPRPGGGGLLVGPERRRPARRSLGGRLPRSERAPPRLGLAGWVWVSFSLPDSRVQTQRWEVARSCETRESQQLLFLPLRLCKASAKMPANQLVVCW